MHSFKYWIGQITEERVWAFYSFFFLDVCTSVESMFVRYSNTLLVMTQLWFQSQMLESVAVKHFTLAALRAPTARLSDARVVILQQIRVYSEVISFLHTFWFCWFLQPIQFDSTVHCTWPEVKIRFYLGFWSRTLKILVSLVTSSPMNFAASHNKYSHGCKFNYRQLNWGIYI